MRNLMPFTYSHHYRAMFIAQIHDLKPVAVIATELGRSEVTTYGRNNQDRVDQGLEGGTATKPSNELGAALRRTGQLATVLAAKNRGAVLFDESQGAPPKSSVSDNRCSRGSATRSKPAAGSSGPRRQGSLCGARSPHPPVRSGVRGSKTSTPSICETSRWTYGWRRVRAELDDAYGQRVNCKLVGSVMRELGISGLPKRRKHRPNHNHLATSEDFVNREFGRDGPNQLWMSDITEHPTREGRVFWYVVLDAWSRKIVGWSIDARPTAAMVNSALAMAIAARKPETGMVVHADHGSQFTSWAFSSHIRSAGLVQSLGTVGDAYDNAMVESSTGSGRPFPVSRPSGRAVLSHTRYPRVGGTLQTRSVPPINNVRRVTSLSERSTGQLLALWSSGPLGT